MTWDAFFTAEVGASAALAGLIFVGVSINLKQIVQLPFVANRALQSLLILLAVLGFSSLQLVPGQGSTILGGEILALSVALWATLNVLELRSWREIDPKYAGLLRNHTVEIELLCLFAFLAGVSLVLGNPWALYWLVPATLGSFVFAILEAWVITVEIMR
jgi:hypothetical protein